MIGGARRAWGGSVHVVLELIEVAAVLVDLLPQLGEPVDCVSELSLCCAIA